MVRERSSLQKRCLLPSIVVVVVVFFQLKRIFKTITNQNFQNRAPITTDAINFFELGSVTDDVLSQVFHNPFMLFNTLALE